MTFKNIRNWSRFMSYNQLVSCNISCLTNKDYKSAYAYNSMVWLSAFRTGPAHTKIKNWKYAVRAYKLHKNTPKSL